MHALRRASRAIEAAFARHRWLHYVVVFALPMSFNLVDKLVALPSILNVYAADSERNSHNKAAGIFLGLLEDFVITALLVLALMVLEIVAKLIVRVTRGVHTSLVVRKVLNVVGHVIQFLFVFALCALTLAPFAADMLLMRTREMRFTTDLIVTYSREKDHASGVEIDPHEITLAKATIVGVALISLLFACVYVWWIDLTAWLLATTTTVLDDSARGFLEGTPHAKGFEPLGTSDLESGKPVKASTTVQSSTDDSTQEENTLIPTTHDDNSVEAASKPHKRFSVTKSFKKNGVFTVRARVLIVVGIVLGYVAIVAITSAIAHAASPLVAAIALNATLQELFRNWLNITFLRGTGSGEITSANYFLHAETEQYTLFRDDVLYRKTTGFKGDLAFDVDVDQKDLPNVLVIGMESHRYLDSLYLSNGTTAAEQMRKHNLTLTPNFDRWAKRGIAFNNMWSGWQTSRSLEAMQFGQINYDSVTDTGTTNGKADVKLSGLPQLFKQKGYKTAFTSGTDITYDQWHKFLPSHGFETALGEPEIKALAEKNYNITKEQWDTDRRAFQWGVHDDLSFAVLGDLVLDDIKEQQTRVKNGQAKTPFYRLHYTISSHVPFESYPTWFKDVKLPDFSPLTDGQKEAPFIQRYATLRYFADMQLGKFLDRMEKEGALKDMIIMMSGDHGISPEAGGSTMYDDQINCQHVAAALIAEGRLGKHAGMVFDDAAMQYDWVNTMADIIGVPAEGFLQTSIGRSLKRAVPWGKRLVWSNNPMKKFAVVRGHERFVYDRTSNEMGLYDTVTDPEEKNNLLPTKSAAERGTWESIRTAGRSLNLYFKTRWEKKCITDVSC